MKIKIQVFISALSICLTQIPAVAKSQSKADSIRTLIIFFDGLRPDYITAETMPNVYAFSKTASFGKQHHSVYPTVTRVNASSYATGSYPETHGIMGNTVYFPMVDSTKGLNTGDAANLMKINTATGGHLLTAVSIGEIIQQAGKKAMVFSSGSTGSSFLQNHTLGGGAIINPEIILPESFKATVINDIGAIPAESTTKEAQHIWVTDAIIKYALQLNGPLVSSVWFADPDHSAHSDGIGSATAMAAIKVVDAQFGRIMETLKNKNLLPYFNIIISTDHGFVTNVGKIGVADFLVKEGLKNTITSTDVVVTDGAIYVKEHDKKRIQQIISVLQKQAWVGAIFTKGIKAGDLNGAYEGTLSFEAIHWNHATRTADILADVNWNDDKNNAGYPGTSFAKGVAGHGSLSPYEVHIALLAAGPSFKANNISLLPTSNIDIVPTVLHIHNLPIPTAMQGRVMTELLTENKSNEQVSVKEEIIKTSVKYEGGNYELILNRTIIGKYQYINFAKTIRSTDSTSLK